MRIQGRVIFVIMLTSLIIIAFSITAGIISGRTSIEKSQETDLMVISQIADNLVGKEVEVLKLQTADLAQNLAISDETQWSGLWTGIETSLNFIGLAVYDIREGIIFSAGDSPAPAEIIEDPYIKQTFEGKDMISSTVPTDEGVVFYLASPMTDTADRILITTLPGLYFTEQLSSIVIWETGHIFIDDAEGNVIANFRTEWVENRMNFSVLAKTDPGYEEIGGVIRRGVNGETGIGYFSIADVPRICAFKPVTDSEEGWFLGVIAPLPESPFRNSEKGMILVGLVSFILSAIFAFIASIYIKRPFEQIEALKNTAESYSKAKTDFLASMSHEIRTPLNVVLGITESQLQTGTLSDDLTDKLEKIHSASILLLNIINDILDLSKIEAGKLEVLPVQYDSASLINDIVYLNMLRFDHKPIKFSLSVDENLPQKMTGDELRIKQILNNILSNAFKYTKSGKVDLTFQRGDSEHPDEAILIMTVQDTGQGMTPEQVARLFDEYTRFSLETNRTITGTGLGMAITHNLVQLMNGTISVESTPGAGSTFTVRLPQKKDGDSSLGKALAVNLQDFQFSDTKKVRRAKITYVPMPYGKVLVVDDISTNIDVATLILSSYQLNIDSAESGFEAIEKVKEGNIYDVIFMDHMMPRMDGIEATRLIREMGYTRPIVALTANAVVGQAEMFLENGFNGFISKPIDITQMNDILHRYVHDDTLSHHEASNETTE